MQPSEGNTSIALPPSLILHGRTEIKARASVLGEVDALSFCLKILGLPSDSIILAMITGATPHRSMSAIEEDCVDGTRRPVLKRQLVAHLP